MKTWIDTETNLEWQVESPKKSMTLDDALEYARLLGDGWRLPEIKELITLVDYSKQENVTKDGVPFWNLTSPYWTSITSSSNDDYTWSVNFHDGHVSRYPKVHSYYVRCVRSVNQTLKTCVIEDQPNSEAEMDRIVQELATIRAERAISYNVPENCFAGIADRWEKYTKCKLSPKDVAVMMADFKLERESHKPKKDNLLDAINYLMMALTLIDYNV